jgi:hypothetical protein
LGVFSQEKYITLELKPMSEVNKYGLPRDIDSETKRIIRKNCGFGCVICGCAIYTYEHVDPVFTEAKEHSPDNIVLLCGTCHNSVTKGIWSKDKVKMATKAPKCLQTGYAHHSFDLGNAHPEITLGTLTWIDTKTIIRVMGDSILEISPPEIDGGPYRLSGIFCNDKGSPILRIIENEWQGAIENWDIEIVGSHLTIRQRFRGIALKLHLNPPKAITIKQINMIHKGAIIIGKEGKGFHFNAPDGSTISGHSKGTLRSCETGVEITENSVAMGCRCQSGEFK